MKRLFCLSQDFARGGVKNYIVGTGRYALLQFTTLLQENVPVEAFCSFKKSEIGSIIMNKPVIDIIDFANDNKSRFIIADEEFLNVEIRLKELGIENRYVDVRMYSLINDCIWTFQ